MASAPPIGDVESSGTTAECTEAKVESTNIRTTQRFPPRMLWSTEKAKRELKAYVLAKGAHEIKDKIITPDEGRSNSTCETLRKLRQTIRRTQRRGSRCMFFYEYHVQPKQAEKKLRQ